MERSRPMRNLLGRLHARDEADLVRIAEFWRVPLAAGNRHQAVGTLYRALTDLRVVRDAWARLDAEQQEVVRLLAVATDTRGAPTLAALGDWLGLPPEQTRRVAIDLYRIGILAREGDDQPLPVGEEPRLFLPRELTLLFRRVLDDIDAGDLRTVPFEVLLTRLDDAEIEAAVAAWGLPALPGLRDRDDLIRRLLRRLAQPGARDRTVAALPAPAARLWRSLLAVEAAQPLAAALAAAGLDDASLRGEQRRQTALDALESALLVWHTYDAAGERLLFIPGAVRSPVIASEPELPPLQMPLPDVEAPAWRHPAALAWDLLTLLRELAEPGAPHWATEGEPARARLRRLNERFWVRGKELPPPGYVSCLLALAQAEGLIRTDGAEAPAWRLTPAVRAWRELPFTEQMDRLRHWWQTSPEWIEGEARDALAVWGVDWPAARGHLLAALVDPVIGLATETWYALESVAARIAAHQPGLLGAHVTVATSRAGPEDEAAAHLATVASAVEVELTTMLSWLGLVEIGVVAAGPLAVRRAGATPEVRAEGPALTVDADGVVTLREPSPLRVWSLSAFADPAPPARTPVYRLSDASIGRALAAGFELEQVTSFLTRQSGSELPSVLMGQLAAWASSYRRVRIHAALWLTVDDPTEMPVLRQLVSEAGWEVAGEIDGALVLRLASPQAPIAPARARMIALLRTHGFATFVGSE